MASKLLTRMAWSALCLDGEVYNACCGMGGGWGGGWVGGGEG